ncbi:hypothetical protein F5Y14DRAFT_410228 [Nemania sp. NC0429]|nr:hypothetical protein F5Y14DRAFT_410228 [Nemania sp. NC0429]
MKESSSIGSEMNTSKRKRSCRGYENDQDLVLPDVDPNRTPIAYHLMKSKSHSTTSTAASRPFSPTNRLLQLEISPHNPLCIVAINRQDPRMPRALKSTLAQLETFQRGDEVVPKQLAPDVKVRQARQRECIADGSYDDYYEYSGYDEFYNFRPSVFCHEYEPGCWGQIKLRDVLDIVTATQTCINDRHPDLSWNMLVHWPIFTLAFGAGGTDIPTTSAATPYTRVSCVPCTAARITDQNEGSKLIDFCVALQPLEDHSIVEAEQTIRELRGRTDGSVVNHTDFYPLRDRPIVMSVASGNSGEGLLEAETQVGVWQAAQWSLLASQSKSGKDSISSLPFLPALLIQGPQWYFAATTREGDQTLLWTERSIGSTDTALGIFQIIRTLRYMAEWSATIYWPWYEREILGLAKPRSTSQ